MDGVIFETQHWRIELAEEQLYLGRAYVACKVKRASLSELTDEEFTDLHNAIKRYEALLATTFGATLFNWSCLMNHAFRQKPYAPQVHFHVRPRYDKDVVVGGEVFHDPNFGDHNHLTTTMSKNVSPKMFAKILETLKSNL